MKDVLKGLGLSMLLSLAMFAVATLFGFLITTLPAPLALLLGIVCLGGVIYLIMPALGDRP